jgi:5-methyltetrahydrofolate--homocysteine methyltransferase
VVEDLPIDEIAGYLNTTALYRNQWQFRPESGESDAEFKDRLAPLLAERLETAKAEGLLEPKVVDGYFPAAADGDDVVIYADAERTSEVARFSFPRQTAHPYLCIADFFRPATSGETDVAAFHIVTMGARASERAAELFAADRYTDYLLTHGLGVEMAEALAEYWHRRIRHEWGFGGEDDPTVAGLFRQRYRGARFSWGYPACPDLEDNLTVARLLGAERIGVEVGPHTGFQYRPEQTTSAIICHHPQAGYFVAGRRR